MAPGGAVAASRLHMLSGFEECGRGGTHAATSAAEEQARVLGPSGVACDGYIRNVGWNNHKQ